MQEVKTENSVYYCRQCVKYQYTDFLIILSETYSEIINLNQSTLIRVILQLVESLY
jgi:hypothetical protein